MRLALYQPEIPQNTGTLLRLGACLNVGVDIIEPCSFVFDDKKMRRAGMDYIDLVDMQRHINWQAFVAARNGHRIILLSTSARNYYHEFKFQANDVLLLGQESCGVPNDVAAECYESVKIPMRSDCRSINVAMAGGIVLCEALRQTQQLEGDNHVSGYTRAEENSSGMV